jgi:membrane-associated protein
VTTGAPRRSLWLLWAWIALCAVMAVAAFSVAQDQPRPDDSDAWPYIAVFALVLGDAVIAVLPGETTLNTASTLAAQGVLELGWVMLAGAVGAVLGDSALYWIARTFRPRIQPRLDAALRNPKVATARDIIGSTATELLVFGRYVPGMRFVVNASLGLAQHPYRDFVRWSALGGTLWSIYNCSVAYLVGTALVGAPVASVVVSALASTVVVAAVFFVIARRYRREHRSARTLS